MNIPHHRTPGSPGQPVSDIITTAAAIRNTPKFFKKFFKVSVWSSLNLSLFLC